MSKLITKLNKLDLKKKAQNKKMCTVWVDEETYTSLRAAVKEDSISVQKLLQTSINLYLEDRTK